MNYFTKKDLLSALNSTTNIVDLKQNDESSCIISEFGGRPLGIFPKEDAVSMLWINPHITNTIKANDRSIGGDRYWISPEREYFYEKPETFEGWFCPPGLDPAKYEILDESQKACTLSTPIAVKNMATTMIYRGEVTRQFRIIQEPIPTNVSYCGIEFIDDCVIFAPDVKMNGWTLANIISGGADNPGTVLIPTKQKATPISYFRPIPGDRLIVEDSYVSYKIDVDDIYKLTIRPEDIDYERPAKIGYVLHLPGSDEYGFLVKLSDDIPKTQEECFDVARDNPEGEIGIIQSYNAESPDKPGFLRYGEIELQLTMFTTIDNASLGKAKHQLFSYVGTKDEILGVVEKYLGITNPKLF